MTKAKKTQNQCPCSIDSINQSATLCLLLCQFDLHSADNQSVPKTSIVRLKSYPSGQILMILLFPSANPNLTTFLLQWRGVSIHHFANRGSSTDLSCESLETPPVLSSVFRLFCDFPSAPVFCLSCWIACVSTSMDMKAL